MCAYELAPLIAFWCATGFERPIDMLHRNRFVTLDLHPRSGDPPGMALFFSGVAFLMAINLAIEPNSSALALEPMGNLAGTAAAVYGTFFFFTGASLGSIISFMMVDRVMPLVVSYFLIGITTTFLVLTDRRIHVVKFKIDDRIG